MGFQLSLRYASFGQAINLFLRGAMTYQTELGTDTFGNLTRINNALDKLPERLEGAKSQLANFEKQIAAAKEELEKPFAQEEELQTKQARLALLNADLNIDGDGGFEIEGDSEFGEEKPEVSDTAYDRDEDADEYDEYEPHGESRYAPPREERQTGTYGKAPPSILDDIRSISVDLKPPNLGGAKSAELDI